MDRPGRESTPNAAEPASPETPDVDVAIIGSGFGGLCMAIQLRKAGRDSFVVFEKGPDVGGTWRVNTYPGCACDIPSHLYSYSFDLNGGWSRMYPTQAEIWKYLRDAAGKNDLYPRVRFNAEVREAVFDPEAELWRVRTASGETTTARVVVSCMGGLSRPKYPRVPGLDRFRGPSWHSAEWNHSVDLEGKRVAVVGTGASAIQFVPQIQPRVAKLHLFQRSPPWVLPRLDRPIRGWERFLFRYLPGYMRAFRAWLFWRQEAVALGYTVNPNLLKPVETWGRRHLARTIPDPELRARLTPDYTVGCKRTLLSNDYLPSLAQPNVEVVSESLTEIRESSVVSADGIEREVDALIFATGFDTLDLTSPVSFVGRNGVPLDELWRRGPQAYYGVAVHGYPNLFFIIGPNSRVANNSIVFMIEAQVHYVLECIEHMHRLRARTIEVKTEAQERYNEALQERMTRTVFVSGCRNWYRDSQGRNPILWPGFAFKYWLRARHIEKEAYRAPA